MKIRFNAVRLTVVFALILFASRAFGQLSKVHYIPPISISEESGNNSPFEQWIYISTPNNSNVQYVIKPLGGAFFHDKNGFQSQLGFQATYAHHINFYRSRAEINQLSFGLSAGGSFHRHDQSKFDPTNDTLLKGTNVNSSGMFVDVGLTYNFMSLYAHATIQNLVFVGKNINDQVLLNNPMRFLASVGNFFEIQPDWALEPSVMVDYVQFVDKPNVDVSLKSHHSLRETQLWVGTSYRKGLTNTLTKDLEKQPYNEPFSQLTGILGINHNKWMFSYTYTVGIGNIKINNAGFHQFTLGIDFLSDTYKPTLIRAIL